MSAPRDRRAEVDALLVEALELPGEERTAFLDRACSEDAELRREVERLLAAGESDDWLTPGAPLDSPLGESLGRDLDRFEALAPGQQVGHYRVIDELGRGGMAVVYRAERADGQFEQEVALKILKRGTDTEEVLNRFGQERQILAALNHSAIARLFDGGLTEDGRSYFVMELVDGLPVQRHCEERQLSLEERLRLFVAICEAVGHAHGKLVVHRDLKPSNILVNAEGEVKLLDFGIAKLLGPTLWDAVAPPTRTELRLLTPEYASPEQVRGEPATTATDIYQLGLLLYELLTGQRPFRATADGAPGDLERRICEEDPAPPSTAVTETVSAAVEEAGDRNEAAALRRFRKRLRGDLDNIVLMALRKEPERRYRTVEQLATDVENYLAGRPVTARRDTLAYRASKFVRRHAAAVAAAVGVLLLLAGLGVAHTARLQRERDRAQQEAAKSDQIARFLTGLFELSAPERALGENLTARQLLDRGRDSIGRDLADQPELKAAMLTVIGGVYSSLGLHTEARPLLEEAVGLRRAHLAAGEPDLAESLFQLGLSRYHDSDLAGARPHLEEALAIQEAALGPSHPAVGTTLTRLGNLYKRLGDLSGSRELLERAVAIHEAAPERDGKALGTALNGLGLLLAKLDEPEAAQEAYERAIAAHESALGADNPLIVATLDNLGHVVEDLGDLERARALYERGRDLAVRHYGPDHRLAANALHSLAFVTAETGRKEEARALYERSIESYERALGPDNLWVTWGMMNLANLLRELGEHEAAWPLYDRALEIRRQRVGPAHNLVGQILVRQARGRAEVGEPDRAEALYREAIGIYRGLAEGRTNLGQSLVELGGVLVERGRRAEAKSALREGLEILRNEVPADDERLAEAEALLARATAQAAAGR